MSTINIQKNVWYRKQGITLIALIITIIVILILSGVVLSLTIGERGIFNTAQKSALEYGKSQVKEEIELAISEIETEQLANGETTNLQILASGKLSDKLGGENVELADGAITGLYKEYEYTIDENLSVTVGEKIKDANEFQSALEYPVLTQNGIVNAKSKNGRYYFDKNVDPKAGDAIGKEAYDGDETTFYYAGNRAWRYMYIDESMWGKSIRILSKGYQGVYFLNENNSSLYFSGWYRAGDKTHVIPDGTKILKYYFNENGGIYEIIIQ